MASSHQKSRRALATSEEEGDSIEDSFFAHNNSSGKAGKGGDATKQQGGDLLTPSEFLARLNISEPGGGGGGMNNQSSNYWSPRNTAAAAAATDNRTGSSTYGRSSKPNNRFDAAEQAALEASRSLASIQGAAPDVSNFGMMGEDPRQHRGGRHMGFNMDYGDGRMVMKERQVHREDELIDDDEDEEDEEEVESSEISASDEDGSWISWFCSLKGNEFFCEVDEDYIQDDFNLTGLNSLVPYYDYALDMVLDVEMPMEDQLTEEQQEIVESAAEMLYGLIHARYIVTNRGMHAMYEKYRSAHFGRCPHVFCQGQPVLPVGLSDSPRNYTVNVFCPRCHGLFFPKSTRQANIDGAYFGTTFPHLYLMTHPDMIPPKPVQNYVPRVFGFKVHSSSLYYRNHDEAQQSESRPRRNKNRSSTSSRR